MMEISEEVLRSLAKEIDSDNSENLAELFIQLLSEEHSTRHQSRPRLVKKFTELIDESQGES